MNSHEALQHFFFSGTITKGVENFFFSTNRGESAARLMPLYNYCIQKDFDPNLASLITSSAGELTNNAFDHNMGFWKDIAGCGLSWSFENNILTLGVADRGRGIIASLGPVLAPQLSPQNILKISFEQVVTGRKPENRGNGLKYVRRHIESSKLNSLVCFSGNVSYTMGTIKPPAYSSLKQPQEYGTLVFTQWSKT